MRKAHAWTFMRMIVDQRLASLNLNCLWNVSATRGIRVGIRPQFHKRYRHPTFLRVVKPRLCRYEIERVPT